jgi:branched-chain amino acid transport system permease protein
VWRGAGVVNFAQMGQAMFTTYIASNLINSGNSYWLAFIVALISGSLLGMVIDLLIMRPLAHKKSSSSTKTLAATIPVIASLGILAVLQALAGIFWAGEERGFPTPVSNFYFKNGDGTLPFSAFNLFVIGVVLIVLLLLTYFFTQTGVGLGMRAAALNPEVARLSGIKVSRMRTLSWAISGLAGSLAGLLITPSTNLSPNSLDLILIVAFTAAVGGLDSPLGAVIGGLILGIGISLVTTYGSPENVFLAILFLLLAVQLIKPNGILGGKQVRRG